MFGLMIIGYGCKKDDDDPVGCSNWANEVSAEATAFSNAGVAWSTNPTTANCQAYKDAGEAYLNALQDHIECATLAGTAAELQSYINSSQATLDSIQC